MSQSKPLTAGIEAPDAEVELSAQDLLELSGPCDTKERASAAIKRPQPVKMFPPSVPARRRAPASRLPVSFVLALGIVGAVCFIKLPSNHADQSVNVPQSQLPASVPQSEGKPVLFANPFDANEVFEFPAGTSEAEAREAVAEILMERAMERQRTFDARVSSNH